MKGKSRQDFASLENDQSLMQVKNRRYTQAAQFKTNSQDQTIEYEKKYVVVERVDHGSQEPHDNYMKVKHREEQGFNLN